MVRFSGGNSTIEIYKFYINAFYVAITRCIKNLYIIEDLLDHPLLKLLHLNQDGSLATMDMHESSQIEWKKELSRLKIQGKFDQAKAIEKSILKKKDVPWKVIKKNDLFDVVKNIIDGIYNEKMVRDLFESAIVYSDDKMIEGLKKVFDYTYLHNSKKYYKVLEKRLYSSYLTPNDIIAQVVTYGVDFRNHFNQTPLMIAAHLGNWTLAKQLRDQGADPNLLDNYNRNSLQIALMQAIIDKDFAINKLPLIYDLLCPDALIFGIDDKYIKYDSKQPKYFLLNFIIALIHAERPEYEEFVSFSAKTLHKKLSCFSNEIIAENKNSSSYLSNYLSKNAHNNEFTVKDHKLFVRMQRGAYIIYPGTMVKFDINIDGVDNLEWEPINFLFLQPSFAVLKIKIREYLKEKNPKIDDKKLYDDMKNIDEFDLIRNTIKQNKRQHSSNKNEGAELNNPLKEIISKYIGDNLYGADLNFTNDFQSQLELAKQLLDNDPEMLEKLENITKLTEADMHGTIKDLLNENGQLEKKLKTKREEWDRLHSIISKYQFLDNNRHK